MKSTKAEGKLEIVNPGTPSIYEQLGITEERKVEIIKETQRIVKDSISTDNKTNAIVSVWNTFDEPNECAFAMYILSHTEEEIVVHELFRLPEVVAENDGSRV